MIQLRSVSDDGTKLRHQCGVMQSEEKPEDEEPVGWARGERPSRLRPCNSASDEMRTT